MKETLRSMSRRLAGKRSMAQFDLDRRAPAISVIDAYWSALCHDGGLPRRKDVDPRALSDVLDRVFVLEEIAPGTARLRVAGQAVAGLFEVADPRGMPICAAVDSTDRPILAQTLRAVLSGPARADLHLRAAGRRGAGLQVRLRLLPLGDDQGRGRFILGAMSDLPPAATPPSAWRIAHQVFRPCDTRPADATPTPQRGHLRLVHSS